MMRCLTSGVYAASGRCMVTSCTPAIECGEMFAMVKTSEMNAAKGGNKNLRLLLQAILLYGCCAG